MRTSLKPALFAFFCSSVSLAFAQSNGPFASYDCRSEVEITRQIELEKKLMEQAQLDSLLQAYVNEALLVADQIEEEIVFDTVDGWKSWTFAKNFDYGKDRGDLPMITSLEALHPYFRDKVFQLINTAKSKGIELAVVESYRTRSKQAEYKGMGRKFTRSGAGSSKHQYGLAVDLVPIVNGEAQWHNTQLWRKVGLMGERLGLRWGGRWRRPYDPGHFEWTAGLNSTDLAYGRKPPIPRQALLYPCIHDDLKLLRKYWNEWEISQASIARKQK